MWLRAMLWILALALVACGESESVPARKPPNFLIIVADDVGTGQIGSYGEAPHLERTPNIDRLGREGLVFERFWAMPSCSPTRAALLTGLYPKRTGIGGAVVPSAPAADGLSEAVDTLPRALVAAGYASAILGKWHLGTHAQGLDHPLRLGFDHHRGSFGNLSGSRGHGSYTDWIKTVDGRSAPHRVYATTDTTNEAIAMAERLEEPWLLIASYNAAHWPFHVPPGELHSQVRLKNALRQRPLAYRAMVEAMDSEMGRLLEGVAAYDPVIFFLGDNGRRRRGRRGKGTLYETGIRVPLIVKHSSIEAPGRRVEGLASVTDLFATLLELSGAETAADRAPIDSVSLVPLLAPGEAASVRDWLYAGSFSPNGSGPYARSAQAVRDHRYKLILATRAYAPLFFDLEADPGEQSPLLIDALDETQELAYQRLSRLAHGVPPIAGSEVRP